MRDEFKKRLETKTKTETKRHKQSARHAGKSNAKIKPEKKTWTEVDT